jgi:hypothetical protein
LFQVCSKLLQVNQDIAILNMETIWKQYGKKNLFFLSD